MKLGINSYTYMWAIGFEGARPQFPLDALGLLKKAQQLEVGLVQTGPNLLMDDSLWQAFFNQAARDHIELEFGIRGLEYAKLLQSVEICRAHNIKLLRTVPEIKGITPSTAELIVALRKIKPYLLENQVRLGLENGKIPCRDLRHAIETVDCSLIGVVLDMVNSLAVPEGWKEVTEVLAPYTMCLHYKDFSIQRLWHMMGFICEGRSAGQGQIDPDWLFRELETAQQDFNVIVELWTPKQSTLDETISLEQIWAESSIEFLRKFIAD